MLNKIIDHTILKADASKDDVLKVVAEAKKYEFYSVMVNPCWVSMVHQELADTEIKTATVIGFPLGATTITAKKVEMQTAIDDGADELDIVWNIGKFKSKDVEYIKKELDILVNVAHENDKLIKVIIETALLTEDELKKASILVMNSGADFIKTSTGFATRGATIDDIKIIKEIVGDNIAIKASGGIHSAEFANELVRLGATRIGTSSSVKIVTQ
ncbi:deoxyribose-phosphate aldolase [Ligilactobacillus agilis]|uniref:deoxyribose-phosphate aldolase n=1 Tax=Ligilactobacillus agilis TaxID=1601 RepID=UPI001CDC3F6C|nr:deoxyribose-phosphate aldolase [Ligilactobacillus agilis]